MKDIVIIKSISIKSVIIFLTLSFLVFVMYNTYKRSHSPTFMPDQNIENKVATGEYKKIILAGGCFWCTESEFNHTSGVVSAVSGYTDSGKENPKYEEVGSGEVRAREAVEVVYDDKVTNLENILEAYWKHIDPTDDGGQFADRGHQYTTAIYYTDEAQKSIVDKSKIEAGEYVQNNNNFVNKKIVTEVLPFANFYPAEEYHQDYKDKNPIRYTAYREGSGRNNFIRVHYKDGSITKMLKVESGIKNWKNFTAKDKAEKLKTLSSLSFAVTQKNDTERPFTDNYNDNKKVGIYVDVVSGEPLFLSSDKYDSGTGWPSFSKPLDQNSITLHQDNFLFRHRTEVRSKIANSHLGHVFDDGPEQAGGKRYCMNGAAMTFVPLEDMEKMGYGEYIKLISN